MQEFLSEHGEIVVGFISLLLVLLVTLASALARVQFKHIDRHQALQDRRIGALEGKVGTLEGETVRTSEQIASLSKTLEHYFEELKEDLRQNQQKNEGAVRELKSLIVATGRAKA